jgi:hypothetical protein
MRYTTHQDRSTSRLVSTHDRILGTHSLARNRVVAVVVVRVVEAAPVVSPAYDDGSTEQDIEQRSLLMYGLRRA